MSMLTVKNLCKTFDGRPVLEDISFSIQAGEIVGIIGRSGAGKTTLLRCLNGVEGLDSGCVAIEGRELGKLKDKELLALRRRIGLVFQNFNLLQSRTVYGNISLALEIAGISKAQRHKRIQELVALVGLDGHDMKYPAQLSGGQKQRVGIARALAANPAVLLCDEATSALDPETTFSILGLLRTINQKFGLTIILITHEMDVIRQLAHRVIVLDQGHIVEDASKEDLIRGQGRHELTRSFLKEEQNGLPERIKLLIQKDKIPEGLPVLKFTISGEKLYNPLISELQKYFGISASILHVSRDDCSQVKKITQIVILYQEDKAAMDWLLKTVGELEVLGYVSPGI